MKQKKETLPPDKVINANIAIIKEFGDIASTTQVIEYVSKCALEQYLKKGMLYEQAVKQTENYLTQLKTQDNMLILLSVNNWYWGGRQIYRFNDELSKTLSNQAKDDMDISSLIINELPCRRFFVMRNFKNSVGFFVDINLPNQEGNDVPFPAILFAEILKDETIRTGFVPITNKDMTLKEVIDNMLSSIPNQTLKQQGVDNETINTTVQSLTEKMQYLLYLSAVNAEITPVTKGAVVHKETSPKPYKNVKYEFSKSEISNVGYKIGAMIKKSKERVIYTYDKNNHKTGTPKSAHLRRSHFHSFWTGSGENKKLVVKWVEAVFIHGNDNENNISTLHEVK